MVRAGDISYSFYKKPLRGEACCVIVYMAMHITR